MKFEWWVLSKFQILRTQSLLINEGLPKLSKNICFFHIFSKKKKRKFHDICCSKKVI